MSDLEVRTGSNPTEEVEFAIACLGSVPTWSVETDQSARWKLTGARGSSRGSLVLHQTGQYWMQVRAFATDQDGQRIASVPLDLSFPLEKGAWPTDFGRARRASARRSTGGFDSRSGNSGSRSGTSNTLDFESDPNLTNEENYEVLDNAIDDLHPDGGAPC